MNSTLDQSTALKMSQGRPDFKIWERGTHHSEREGLPADLVTTSDISAAAAAAAVAGRMPKRSRSHPPVYSAILQ